MRHRASFLSLLVPLVFLQMVKTQPAQVTMETAPYTVINEAQGYEERAYPASRWVCHTSTLQDPTMAANSFWPLYDYISSANNRSEIIPMTAPVTVKLKESTENGTWDNDMCFYLPAAQQEDPPVPLSPDVHLENRAAMNVFARQTGGNLTAEQWTSLANELKTILKTAQPAADLSTYYIVGYDPPSKATDRRNEVWFQKTEQTTPP